MLRHFDRQRLGHLHRDGETHHWVRLIWTAGVLTWVVMKFTEVLDRLKRIERTLSALPPADNK